MVRLKRPNATPLKPVMPKFQFLYGAIKTAACTTGRQFLICFNSSMVRLKRTVPGAGTLKAPCFNSSMVRLKLHAFETAIGASKFQFLYGAIKTQTDPETGFISVKFQFLYGAIKTIMCLTYISRMKSFNSSMVRLKPI